MGKSSQFANHTTDEGQEDKGLRGFGEEVVFPIEASIKGQSSETPFDDPALLITTKPR